MASSENSACETIGTANVGLGGAQPHQARRNPERIADLIPSLFENSAKAAFDTSDAIAALIAGCTADELLRLDEHIRWLYDWNGGRVWAKLQPGDIQKLPTTELSRPAILGLASCHRSGQVREAAVRALDDLRDGTGLPFLLIRNNDWVANVQRCARVATERRVREGRFDLTIRNLELLFRLLNKRRAEHSDLVVKVVEQLLQPEHRHALLRLLDGSNRLVRRTVFRLGLDIPGVDLVEFIDVGIRNSDPVIRLWAVRNVNAIAESNKRQDLLENAEVDSFLPVRREVLQMRLEHLPEQAESYLRTALLDPSPTMREFARFHLRKRGVTSFREFYHALLQEETYSAVAIAGIGETGRQADIALVLPYVAAERSRTRKAAVRAIGQLSPDQHMDLLVERLRDNSPGVSQEAARWLKNKVADIGIARLWKLFQGDERQHVKLSVLRLADGLSTWAKLPLFIEAAANSDARISGFARTKVESMYNRVFTLPSADEGREIQQALDRNHGSLEPLFRDSIRNWISLRREQNG